MFFFVLSEGLFLGACFLVNIAASLEKLRFALTG